MADAQKYTLRVDGKPFYATEVQIRLDKLRYWWNFDAAARQAVVAQAASDGFNTLTIPIHWYEVEPTKNNLNWTILDEYLGYCNTYNVKMELLWFGQNSGGWTQWLGDPSTNPVHLRTPDYVLYSPAPNSAATTSDFALRRDMSNYTLDLADNTLRSREQWVMGQIIAHIASWDASHGNKHTVIGVQIDNEIGGRNSLDFPTSLIVSYMSDIASAIKTSSYSVWTRLNCLPSLTNGRIVANEALRSGAGTNIDFVGMDIYGTSASAIRTAIPYNGGNYRMIMESGAEVSDAAIYQLAALSGNNAYDHYDMISPDGHSLYDRVGASGFTPRGSSVADIRTLNKLINSDIADIAMNSNGYGLFVHNYAGNSTSPTTYAMLGITYTPSSTTSQGISIRRSNTEAVLMSTKGGTFNYPSTLGINGASKGYFDSNNAWVNQGSVSFTSTSVTVAAGTTVRLTMPNTGFVTGVRRQAEFATIGGGAVAEASSLGFSANGYVNFNASGGYVQWGAVDGLSGGTRTIRFRYTLTGTASRTMSLTINGSVSNNTFPPSDATDLEKFGFLTVTASLTSGTTNTIKLQSTGQDGPNIDELSTY